MNGILDFAKLTGLVLAGVLLLVSAAARACALPFVLGLLLAAWLDRPVTRLALRLPRWLAALVILTLTALLALSAVTLLAVQLWRDIPDALEGLAGAGTLLARLEDWAQRLPPLFSGALLWLLGELQTQGSALTERLTAGLADQAAGWVAALPGRLFAAGVGLLAAFYAAADWTRVRAGLWRLLPADGVPAARALLRRLRWGASAWLRAQGRLMGLTFLLLLGGLLLLRVPAALPAALLVSVADALPLIGSGLILLPWALVWWAQGEGWRALALTALWALSAAVRTALEPRLLGAQAGVSPLLTLLVMYAGLQWFGAGGLIAGPVLLSAAASAFHPPAAASDAPAEDR